MSLESGVVSVGSLEGTPELLGTRRVLRQMMNREQLVKFGKHAQNGAGGTLRNWKGQRAPSLGPNPCSCRPHRRR